MCRFDRHITKNTITNPAQNGIVLKRYLQVNRKQTKKDKSWGTKKNLQEAPENFNLFVVETPLVKAEEPEINS